MRSILLAGSQNRWLRERAPKHAFVRRAVSRFMPGEELDDMLRAVQALAPEGIHAVFTRLGENVTDPAEADAVASQYLDAIDRVRTMAPPPEPSVKLTQLGLDFDRERCYAHVRALAARADAMGNYLWIDMEEHALRGHDAGPHAACARRISARRRVPAGLPLSHRGRSGRDDRDRGRRPAGEGGVPASRAPSRSRRRRTWTRTTARLPKR